MSNPTMHKLVKDLAERLAALREEVEKAGINLSLESADGKKTTIDVGAALMQKEASVYFRMIRPVHDEAGKVISWSGTDGIFTPEDALRIAAHIMGSLLPHGILTCPHCKGEVATQCFSCGHLGGRALDNDTMSVTSRGKCTCGGCVADRLDSTKNGGKIDCPECGEDALETEEGEARGWFSEKERKLFSTGVSYYCCKNDHRWYVLWEAAGDEKKFDGPHKAGEPGPFQIEKVYPEGE